MLGILVLSNMYPSEQDPTYGTFVKIFCDGMERQGFEVDRIVLKGRSGISEKIAKYLRFGYELSKEYLWGKQDVVYVHYILHLAPLLLLLRIFRRRCLILNVHGGDILPRNMLHRFLFYFARLLSAKANAIVVPSEFFRKMAARQLQIAPDLIKVWGSSGVDSVNFNRACGLHQDQSVIQLIYVSRLDSRKGWHVLLAAMAELLVRKRLGVQLTLVGHGSPREIEELEGMITTLGLGGICSYLGAKTHQELPRLLQTSDLFVFPTLYEESLGLVALEAMACGLPVVGSRIGALPEYIEEGKTGFLFEPGNAQAMADAMERAFASLAVDRNRLKNACLGMAQRYERSRLEFEMAQWLSCLIR